MKYILLTFVVFIIHTSSGEKVGQCSVRGIHCSSCTEVSLCADTEYGSVQQHITTCPKGKFCMNGRCSSTKNPLCDGTVDIPFECHVPGAFPDPFDCHYYHLCVVVDQNETDVTLMDYKQKCQENENGRAYGFDSKTLTCSEPLGQYGECEGFPIPPCFLQGQTTYVERNKNIYFVCEKVGDLLYPQLFACPFGQMYYPHRQQCDFEMATTPPPATTAPPATTYPPTTPTYPTTPTPYPTTYPPKPTTRTPYPTTYLPTTLKYTTAYPTTRPPYYTTRPPYVTTRPPYVTTPPPYYTTRSQRT